MIYQVRAFAYHTGAARLRVGYPGLFPDCELKRVMAGLAQMHRGYWTSFTVGP